MWSRTDALQTGKIWAEKDPPPFSLVPFPFSLFHHPVLSNSEEGPSSPSRLMMASRRASSASI